MTVLTIAFPAYNEGDLIQEFVEALDQVCLQLPAQEVHLLVVNDGSTDTTVAGLHRAALRNIRQVKIVNLSRNVGQPHALQCLVAHLSSPLNIILDCDFQDDPALIPELIKKHQETGAEIVRVARGKQAGGLTRAFFYAFRLIFRHLTGDQESFGTFGLYSLKAVNSLKQFSTEYHYYLPGLVTMIGLKTDVLKAARPTRRRGTSRVGVDRLFKLAFDAVFSFSAFPIRAASVAGVLIMAIGLLGILVIVYIRLFTVLAIPGWASILSAITFFGGIQLLFLGILGEYTARIFEQVKHRPLYFIESTETLPQKPHATPVP